MSIKESPSACICADENNIAKVVLFPGDPLRAKTVAQTYLENPVLFNTVRNMLGYTGVYRGRRISVMGSGMGIPSATLYAHELYNFYGVEAIIRIGTAGGVAEDVKLRDLVVAMTASTNSNFSAQYSFPGILAPQASFDMLRAAVAAAEKLNVSARVGQVFTADMFYNADEKAGEMYRAFGVLALEMETAGLYWEAMASRKKALSLLSVSDLVFTGQGLTAAERQDTFREMMEVALETAWSFSEE